MTQPKQPIKRPPPLQTKLFFDWLDTPKMPRALGK